ncbi:MAG: hypothetical protein IH942_09215 [Acidobacteria bacterium]|nr:hypothetical protein [Acidobacteriota bacterium]
MTSIRGLGMDDLGAQGAGFERATLVFSQQNRRYVGDLAPPPMGTPNPNDG